MGEDQAANCRPAPNWVAPIFAVLGALTIPWTVYLSLTLPTRVHTQNYRLAWVGFDVMLTLALLATAYAAWRGNRIVGQLAAVTATMLIVDAWFDVTTSRRSEVSGAILSAALIEIPLAFVCAWIALHVDRVMERRIRYLARLHSAVRSARSNSNQHGRSRLEEHAEARLEEHVQANLEEAVRDQRRLDHHDTPQ